MLKETTDLEKEEEGALAVVDPNNKEHVPFSVAVVPAILSGGAGMCVVFKLIKVVGP